MLIIRIHLLDFFFFSSLGFSEDPITPSNPPFFSVPYQYCQIIARLFFFFYRIFPSLIISLKVFFHTRGFCSIVVFIINHFPTVIVIYVPSTVLVFLSASFLLIHTPQYRRPRLIRRVFFPILKTFSQSNILTIVSVLYRLVMTGRFEATIFNCFFLTIPNASHTHAYLTNTTLYYKITPWISNGSFDCFPEATKHFWGEKQNDIFIQSFLYVI